MFNIGDKNLQVFICPACKTKWDKEIAEKNDFICCPMNQHNLKEFSIPVVWQVYGTVNDPPLVEVGACKSLVD